MEAVKQHGNALTYASAELRGDREIVMEAVKQNGHALGEVSAELKDDREIVLAAVASNHHALVHATMKLRRDREIVLHAIAQSAHAMQFAMELQLNGASSMRDYVDHLTSNVFNVSKHAFVSTILFGAKEAPPPSSLCDNSACVLSLLRPGPRLPAAFSEQAKRLIWTYAGVRSGERWLVIRAAASNLQGVEAVIPRAFRRKHCH